MDDLFSGNLGIHLKELRQRLMVSAAVVIAFSGVAYYFSEPIARFFMAPLFTSSPLLTKLVYTNLTEAFVTYIKVALLVGVICSFPVLIYETWMFVAPGLEKSEKWMVGKVVFWGSGLFLGGIVFSYFAVLPRMLHFLMSFAGPGLKAMPKLDGYLTFVARLALSFGLAFEIPFLMVAAAKVGLVTRKYFIEKRKYAYLGILMLSFLLTVGDPFATLFLTVPLIGLYEAGVLVMRIFLRES
ncbi:MAG: twin-arginine translocase subunit TatC [Desulfobulbaceae bacterium]|nr:twin-arginine translocase subunit TatC [Desulfobulbaceae bacterium]